LQGQRTSSCSAMGRAVATRRPGETAAAPAPPGDGGRAAAVRTIATISDRRDRLRQDQRGRSTPSKSYADLWVRRNTMPKYLHGWTSRRTFHIDGCDPGGRPACLVRPVPQLRGEKWKAVATFSTRGRSSSLGSCTWTCPCSDTTRRSTRAGCRSTSTRPRFRIEPGGNRQNGTLTAARPARSP